MNCRPLALCLVTAIAAPAMADTVYLWGAGQPRTGNPAAQTAPNGGSRWFADAQPSNNGVFLGNTSWAQGQQPVSTFGGGRAIGNSLMHFTLTHSAQSHQFTFTVGNDSGSYSLTWINASSLGQIRIRPKGQTPAPITNLQFSAPGSSIRGSLADVANTVQSSGSDRAIIRSSFDLSTRDWVLSGSTAIGLFPGGGLNPATGFIIIGEHTAGAYLPNLVPLPPAAWAGISTLAGIGFIGAICRRRQQA